MSVKTSKNNTAFTERSTFPKGTREISTTTRRNTAIMPNPVNVFMKNSVTIYIIVASSFVRGSSL